MNPGNATPPALDWSRVATRLDRQEAGFNYCPDGYRLAPDWFRRHMAAYDLWFMTSGRGILETPQGEKLPLQRGTVVLFRPGDVYDFYHLPGSGMMGVHWFHLELFREAGGPSLPVDAPELEFLPRYGEAVEVSFFETCCKKIHVLFRRARAAGRWDEGDWEQANLLFRNLLMEYASSCRLQHRDEATGVPLHHRRLVSELLSLLYERPERFQSVAEVARHYGFSPSYFSRIVKAVDGRQLKQVMIDAKIEQAKHLLLSTTAKLENISDDLGYTGVFYFFRQFKQQTGKTPSEFRAAFGGGSGGYAAERGGS
ncbi:MAG TPA: helix-turn-helix transcriptional regulator [Chthoniobacteraceae bacterium]|nr:helix-turn-helix transcriptional regulator [Chthoniobacteraceae bacterium]